MNHPAAGELHLLFSLGADRYALPAGAVRRVLPLRPLKRLPEVPDWVAGVFVHGGVAVPVLDLAQRALGRAAQLRASTRLVLVAYRGEHTLGLILEQASATCRLRPEAQRDSGVAPGAAGYLGAVQADSAGLLQRITIDRLLPDDVTALLFPVNEQP